MSNQNVLLHPLHWATFVLWFMESKTAHMIAEMEAQVSLHWLPNAVATNVTLTKLVFLTRPLDLVAGSRCTQHFALLMAVAARVSENFLILYFINDLSQVLSTHQTTRASTLSTLKRLIQYT